MILPEQLPETGFRASVNWKLTVNIALVPVATFVAIANPTCVVTERKKSLAFSLIV